MVNKYKCIQRATQPQSFVFNTCFCAFYCLFIIIAVSNFKLNEQFVAWLIIILPFIIYITLHSVCSYQRTTQHVYEFWLKMSLVSCNTERTCLVLHCLYKSSHITYNTVDNHTLKFSFIFIYSYYFNIIHNDFNCFLFSPCFYFTQKLFLLSFVSIFTSIVQT